MQEVRVGKGPLGIRIPREERAALAESDPVVKLTESHLRMSTG